jgi:hypothetical protein
MAQSNPELWQRLAAFEVSPPENTFSFAKRLAREHGWSPQFARRAFDEYRRFLYLSVVVGQRLSPSETVDRVWRLHLSYRASYGQALCQGVLGRRLPHEAPQGIGRPAGRQASYRATLAAYEQEFGRAPPAEIWPTAGRRAAAAKTASKRPTAPRPRRAVRKARELPAVPLMPAADRG